MSKQLTLVLEWMQKAAKTADRQGKPDSEELWLDARSELIEIANALKTCEHALREAVRTGKVGWMQKAAHKLAVNVLPANNAVISQ